MSDIKNSKHENTESDLFQIYKENKVYFEENRNIPFRDRWHKATQTLTYRRARVLWRTRGEYLACMAGLPVLAISLLMKSAEGHSQDGSESSILLFGQSVSSDFVAFVVTGYLVGSTILAWQLGSRRGRYLSEKLT
jgi:hypothetical protein